MYSYDIRVGYSSTAPDLKMTIPALLDCFQDAATFEAQEGTITMEYLGNRHLAWLLGSWQIVLLRRPKIGETIRITTMPYEFKSFLGYRNFTAKAQDGELLVKAASIWTLIDMEKLRPAKPTEEILSGYPLGERLDMEYAPRKILLLGEGKVEDKITIRRSQIDSNRHVNNVEYVKMAMEFLPFSDDGAHKEIKLLRAEYKKAAHYGDILTPIVHQSEDKLQVALCNEGGEPDAIVEFTV